MAKPSKMEIATKSTGSTYTATEANLVHTTVDAVIDDYASISEGVDADTLEGSTKAEVQSHAPASHGNEAHTSAFITAEDVPSGSGAAGRDGVGFKPNMGTLWNKANGDIPDGYIEDSELAGTDWTIIKYVGGETMTDYTQSFAVDAGATITITVAGNFVAANGTFYFPLVTSTDKSITLNFAKSDASDVVYIIYATTAAGVEDFNIPVTVHGESNIDVKLTCGKAYNFHIGPL